MTVTVGILISPPVIGGGVATTPGGSQDWNERRRVHVWLPKLVRLIGKILQNPERISLSYDSVVPLLVYMVCWTLPQIKQIDPGASTFTYPN